MVNIIINSGFGYDIRGIDFSEILNASSYTRSATSFVAQYAMGKEAFSGINFAYDRMGAPIGGTVKSYATWHQATKAFLVEGLNVSITSIINAAKTAGIADDFNVISNALAGADNFKGGNGNDYVKLFGGNDVATGNGGNDTIFGGTGNDTISGGDGNDWLSGDAGADKLDGGAGTDTASYSTATAGMTANLAKAALNTGDAKGDVYVSIEYLIGSNYADKLYGNAGVNLLSGGAGNDLLSGDAGNDTLRGGAGADRLDGGVGTDTATYAGATAGVTANLANAALNTGDAKGDVYVSIEYLAGSSYADKLYGNTGANLLSGGAGNDLLSGAAGNDVLIGGAGADRLDGGAGTDTASYSGAAASVVANLANATANIGDAKGDVYVSIENLTGTNYADKLYGNTGANVLSGGSGNDLLSGNAGNDTLYGGLGADSLTGGAGADTFIFKALSDTTVAATGRDTIFDFSGIGGDRLDLSAIDAKSSVSGDQAFTFIGTAAFSGKAGELNYSKQASDTYVYGDTNGDKKADFAIHLDDAVLLSKGYFIL